MRHLVFDAVATVAGAVISIAIGTVVHWPAGIICMSGWLIAHSVVWGWSRGEASG